MYVWPYLTLLRLFLNVHVTNYSFCKIYCIWFWRKEISIKIVYDRVLNTICCSDAMQIALQLFQVFRSRYEITIFTAFKSPIKIGCYFVFSVCIHDWVHIFSSINAIKMRSCFKKIQLHFAHWSTKSFTKDNLYEL